MAKRSALPQTPPRSEPAAPRAAEPQAAETQRPARKRAWAEDHSAFLALIGQRLRKARARRGMSRKILAADSGLSERYIAQLEGGSGNASIAALRQIALAMDLPLAEIIGEPLEGPPEARRLSELLARLSPEELALARRLLESRFQPTAPAGREGRIALIGLRGAGKSTLGQRLAEHLGVPFLELDEEIERAFGIAIPEIFALYGQPGFRRYEQRCLEMVLARHARAVIATGGGLVAERSTYELLLASCFTVWLRASPEEHMQRVIEQGDLRPMADNSEAMEDLRQILAEREPLYARADATLDTGGTTPERALKKLLSLLGSRGYAI